MPIFCKEAILALLKASFIAELNLDLKVAGMGTHISRPTLATRQGPMDMVMVVAMAMEVMEVMLEAMTGQVVTQTTHIANAAAALNFTLEAIAMVVIPTSTPSAIPMATLAYTAVAMLFVVAMDITGCTQVRTIRVMAVGTTDHKGCNFGFYSNLYSSCRFFHNETSIIYFLITHDFNQ